VTSRYMLRGGIQGRERLRLIARALGATTGNLFDRLGIDLGLRCLDVGCGGGDVALELARRVRPSGRVLGVDIDDAKLELARHEASAAGLSNVEYRNADVLAGALDERFDVVYARFLLSHLADPAGATTMLVGAARPHGIVAVEDIDYRGSFAYPESRAHDRYRDIYMATARARDGDPTIGPRLPSLLAAAGCVDVGVHIVQPAALDPVGAGADVKLAIPLTLENIADAAVAEGVAERDELEAVAGELHRLAADPATLLSFPRIVQAWGRAPA
jgi:SAM-dependent methyltransferase